MTSPSIPWDQIVLLLKSMGAALNDLYELLREEETVMKHLDRDRVDDLLAQKEGVLSVLTRLDQEVLSTLRPLMASSTSKVPANWWSFLAQGKNVQEYGLAQSLSAIKSTAERIRDQGRKNAMLIRRGQLVVGEAINLVLSGLGHVSVYQGTGTLRAHPVPGSVNLQG